MRRIAAAISLVLVVATGLVVHGVLPDSAATDIAGDALYAVAVLAFVVGLAPGLAPVWAGAIAAVWCVGVELFQLTGVPLAAAEVFPPAVLVLGTVFDARDIAVYVVAIVVAVAIDVGVSRRRDRGAGRSLDARASSVAPRRGRAAP